jgi:hypothetical protein
MWVAYLMRRRTIIVGYHPIGGLVTYVLMVVVILLGMISMFKRKFLRDEWNSTGHLFWVKVHKYLAFFLIFLSQATLTAGIYVYYF